MLLLPLVCCTWQEDSLKLKSWLQAARLLRSLYVSDMPCRSSFCRAGKAVLTSFAGVPLDGKVCNWHTGQQERSGNMLKRRRSNAAKLCCFGK
jgi:hypothetical protein